MKTIIHTFLAIAVFVVTATGQSPKSFKYQTIVRDANGEIITNQQVTITLIILQGSESGTVVCTEDFISTTNDFGLVNLQIGSVDPTTFAAIDWTNGPYFTKVELDGNAMGTSELLSVPYAFCSEVSTNMSLNTSVTGDTLFLVPGNYVIIPGISAANTENAVVTTNLITDVTSTSAIVGYTALLYGGPAITERGVCWDTDTSPTINGFHTNDGTGTGTYNSQITDLMPATTYFVRAYATNSLGTTYGELKNFTTVGGTLPVVVLDTIKNIIPNAAGGYGYITYEGSSGVYERGFCWNTVTNPTVYHYHVNCGGGAGSFTGALTTLIPNETYFARAYATNSTGTSYSMTKSFTTTNAYYEGFENGFPSSSGWEGTWSVVNSNPYDGYYCLFTDVVGDIVNFSRTFSQPGQISFYYFAPWNSFYGSATTKFYIDDTLIGSYNEIGWTIHSSTYSAGTHTFKWEMMGGGAGLAFIDYTKPTQVLENEAA
jgi:hypothetical protein